MSHRIRTVFLVNLISGFLLAGLPTMEGKFVAAEGGGFRLK